MVFQYTFPATEQLRHLRVVGALNGRSKAFDTEIGSMFKHTPLEEQRAQAKYPLTGSSWNISLIPHKKSYHKTSFKLKIELMV